MTTRTIKVNLARVEGEGGSQLKTPDITAPICGICPASSSHS